MKTFIEIRKEIFQLEQVSNARYTAFPREEVERFNLPNIQVELFMQNGQSLLFTEEDARQVWDALQASAVNITPKTRS